MSDAQENPNDSDGEESIGIDLTQGPVPVVLRRLAMPMVWGLASIIAFSFVDTFYISKLGTQPLAAVTFTVPVMFFINEIFYGLGIGVASVISRSIGEGDNRRVRRMTRDSLILAIILGLVLTYVGYSTLEPLFTLLGADERTLPYIEDYMYVIYGFLIIYVLPMFGFNALRAAGDTKSASLILVWSGVVNILLDPIMIFGLFGFPRMEVMGAALATGISQFVTMIATFYLLKKRGMISFKVPDWSEMFLSWKEMLHVGGPAALTYTAMPIAMAFITSLLAKHGDATVAGLGVAMRIEEVLMLPFFALSSVMGPFAGQNLGAGHYDRIHSGVWTNFRFSVAYGLFCAVVLFAISGFMPQIFDPNPQTVATAQMHLRIVPWCYMCIGIYFGIVATFNGLGEPRPPMVLNLTRILVLLIPSVWLGERLGGVLGLFIALPIANYVAVAFAFVWYERHMKALLNGDIAPQELQSTEVIGGSAAPAPALTATEPPHVIPQAPDKG